MAERQIRCPVCMHHCLLQPGQIGRCRARKNENGKSRPAGMDKTNMLRCQLGEKGWAVVRPSGTEPKMKIYLNFWGKTQEKARELAEKVLTQLREILES